MERTACSFPSKTGKDVIDSVPRYYLAVSAGVGMSEKERSVACHCKVPGQMQLLQDILSGSPCACVFMPHSTKGRCGLSAAGNFRPTKDGEHGPKLPTPEIGVPTSCCLLSVAAAGGRHTHTAKYEGTQQSERRRRGTSKATTCLT